MSSKPKVKVVLNSRGVASLLKSDEISTICETLAGEQAARIGGAYKTSTRRGKNRVNASIYTDDPKAIRDNLKNNTVLKNLGLHAGGGTR